MERTERFYKIERLLRPGKPVPIGTFLAKLEVSRQTFVRDIEYLRERFDAPIVWVRADGGYRLAPDSSFELPGLWFNESEVHALLTMQHLLQSLDAELLGPHIQPLQTRLKRLLRSKAATYDEIEHRIRIIRGAARKPVLQFFERLATAVLTRKKVNLKYWSRQKNETTERTVSPQRLVHYRENWYVDIWCHLRNDIRTLALDGIKSASPVNEPAKFVSDKDLDETLASGYGIFAGKKTTWAVLKFSPERARFVADEEWHPRQRSRTESSGAYILEVPFSDDRELTMDILKYGPDVEVLAPESLRVRVAGAHQAALQQYQRS
jgi:predicted DNA-binding transcriptional regulator YafY